MAGKPGLTLHSLYVAHWRLGNGPDTGPWPVEPGLPVATCLRRVWVSVRPPAHALAGEAEHYADIDAYRFLLEFITGLHSAIPGETNVLGQFRQAWRRWRAAAPQAAAGLAPVIDALLRDARRVRAAHLQGVGGESYGSLVRRLLRPARSERILVVGTGDLARSIWPFFQQHTVGTWNHRDGPGSLPPWTRTFSSQEGARAARWADHVVLTTPPDPANDARWASWLTAAQPRSVAHLGHRRGGDFQISSTDRLYFLEQLFELRHLQANVRSLQVERARNACRELAACCNVPVQQPRRARA